MVEQANAKYKDSSNEEKNIKREYGRNKYQNVSIEDTQRLKEYQKEWVERV